MEYLGYILSEIVNPSSLEERGFAWHQAADLPAIDDTLQQASKIPNGRLRTVMSNEKLKTFRHLIHRSREIRNSVAHHRAPCEQRMKDLRYIKEKLSR